MLITYSFTAQTIGSQPCLLYAALSPYIGISFTPVLRLYALKCAFQIISVVLILSPWTPKILPLLRAPGLYSRITDAVNTILFLITEEIIYRRGREKQLSIYGLVFPIRGIREIDLALLKL